MAAALAFAELGLRVAGVKLTGSTYQADRTLGWSLRPGAGAWQTQEGVAWTRINSHGFRDRERTRNKPPGTYRIAVVGDSITEGRHVEMDETFTALLEGKLSGSPKHGGESVEALNFGVPGYGTAQELLLLDRVWTFEPDLVLLAFFARNDLYNNVPALDVATPSMPPYFRLEGGELVLDETFLEQPELIPERIRLKRAFDIALEHSRVLQLAYQLRLMRHRVESLAKPANRARAAEGVPDDYHSFWFYLPPEHPAMLDAWAVTEALIGRFAKDVEAHGAAFALVSFPAAEQVSPDGAVRRRLAGERGVEDFEYADRRVARIAEEAGAAAFVLAPAMRDYAVANRIYLNGFENTEPGVGHFNAAGHRLIAELLAETLGSAEIRTKPAKLGHLIEGL